MVNFLDLGINVDTSPYGRLTWTNMGQEGRLKSSIRTNIRFRMNQPTVWLGHILKQPQTTNYVIIYKLEAHK